MLRVLRLELMFWSAKEHYDIFQETPYTHTHICMNFMTVDYYVYPTSVGFINFISYQIKNIFNVYANVNTVFVQKKKLKCYILIIFFFIFQKITKILFWSLTSKSSYI